MKYQVEFYNPSVGRWAAVEEFRTKIWARRFIGKRITNSLYSSKWRIMNTSTLPWTQVMMLERDDGDRR